MKLLNTAIAAASLAASAGFALAADLPARKGAPMPPPSSTTCLESAALPVDAFGFTAGSDVTDYGAIGGTLTYGGAYTTRGAATGAHTGTAGLFFGVLPCFEIGPYAYGGGVSGVRPSTTFYGGGSTFRYKFLGRDVHGIGLAAELDLSANGARAGGVTGSFYTVAGRLVLDAALVPDKLYFALNLEHFSNFRGTNTVDSSMFNVRAALSAKVADNLFVGVDALYSRAHGGTFYDGFAGDAFFVGPNFFWAVTDKLTLNAAYQVQVAGSSKGGPGRINLNEYSQHLARVRLGYAF